MRKLRIGQLGVGHPHASGKMNCVRRFPDLFEVVGVAEPDDALFRREAACGAYDGVTRMDVKDLLAAKDLDAVMVEPEEWNLVPYANLCADAGVHIHLDKPAGEDIGEYERLMSEAKRKNLVVQLAYMYRYNPSIAYAIDAARSGKLGEIVSVDAEMNTEHPLETRRWLAHFKGGILHFLGCHMIDLVLLAQGVPDEIIPLNRKTGLDGVDAVDHGFAAFVYPRGISTVRATSTDVGGYGRRHFVVSGSKGSIQIEPLEYPTHIYETLSEDTVGKTYALTRRELNLPGTPREHVDRYDNMMLAFRRCALEGEQNPYTCEYELRLQRVCLKACGFDVDFRK